MRIIALDYIRALAILMVMFCHWGESVGWKCCSLAGCSANCIFFVLSGLCLGIRWREDRCSALGIVFIKRRFIKIYIPFVIFLSLYLAVSDTNVLSKLTVVLNYLMLSWFAKLPGGRHLWFVTGIVLCYLVLWLMSRVGSKMRINQYKSIIVVVLLCVAIQGILALVGINQAYYLTLLLGAILAFIYGDKWLALLTSRPRESFLSGVVGIIMVMLMYIYKYDAFVNSPVAYYWGCMVVGLSLMAMVMSSGIQREHASISFIGIISYELYLVHFPFCSSSSLHLAQVVDSKCVYAMVFFVVSVVAAYLLRLVSLKCQKIIERCNISYIEKKGGDDD